MSAERLPRPLLHGALFLATGVALTSAFSALLYSPLLDSPVAREALHRLVTLALTGA